MSYLDSELTRLSIELAYGNRTANAEESFHRDQFALSGIKYMLDLAPVMVHEDRRFYSDVIRYRLDSLKKSPFFSRLGWESAMRRRHTH